MSNAEDNYRRARGVREVQSNNGGLVKDGFCLNLSSRATPDSVCSSGGGGGDVAHLAVWTKLSLADKAPIVGESVVSGPLGLAVAAQQVVSSSGAPLPPATGCPAKGCVSVCRAAQLR